QQDVCQQDTVVKVAYRLGWIRRKLLAPSFDIEVVSQIAGEKQSGNPKARKHHPFVRPLLPALDEHERGDKQNRGQRVERGVDVRQVGDDFGQCVILDGKLFFRLGV